MSTATVTAPIMDHVNLAFVDHQEDEAAPAPAYFCATFGSSLSREQKLARLKNLEDAGYNKSLGGTNKSTSRWDDDLVAGLAAMSERDLADFLASKSDEDRALITRASRRVKLRAETGQVIKDMERMSDAEMAGMLAQMSRAERAALAEIADAWS